MAIDDPVLTQTSEEAEASRKRAMDLIWSVARCRTMGVRRVVVSSRVHKDDLTVTTVDARGYKHLVLPDEPTIVQETP